VTTFAQTRATAKPAGYDQIVVDGIDVTWFRATDPGDQPMALPGYQLTEPFAYGPTTLTVPRVNALFETLGEGDLSWIRKGASVVFNRIDDPTAETPTILATDYVGVVIKPKVDGPTVTLECGGQFSGRAAMLNEQPALIREEHDVGRWAQQVAATVGLTFTPWRGPVTGIKHVGAGGQSLLGWAQEVCTMSQDDDGVQRALMPTSWGSRTWAFEPKDYTTRDLTVFSDDARVVLSVADDAAEQPNVWYGTCTTPDGVRIRNARWPGVFQGPPPTYPIAGGSSFGVGTTDADTINNDGITVLNIKLVQMGYLDPNHVNTGVYDTTVGAAVKHLKADAGLTVNTTMTQAAWNALWDIDVTGYSLWGARVFPFVEDDRVRQWNYTSNGSIAGRNPAYDNGHTLRVERNVEGGSGLRKARLLSWLRGQQARTGAKNWTGTMRFEEGFGGFDGEWGPGDAEFLQGAGGIPYVRSVRDVRPGMNIWEPHFDGGTLFHVSGMDIDPGGRSGTAYVDTQARDLMEVAAIIARNAESRHDMRREWLSQNRPTRASHALVERDENFGILDRNVKLRGGRWNVVQVIVGQHGQVNKTRLRILNAKAAFAMVVASVNLTEARLDRWIGNPLAAVADGGQAWWEEDDNADRLENKDFLYAAGTHDQPCGYWPRKHTNDKGNTTSFGLTGKWVDDANWSYICAAGTRVIVNVGIWPDRDGVLQKGQIFWAQEDDVV
jgi:hypothetical protein